MERNKNSNTKVYRYLTRLIVGLLVGINVGIWLDTKLGTTPLFILVIVIYVVGGTMYLLIKEAS